MFQRSCGSSVPLNKAKLLGVSGHLLFLPFSGYSEFLASPLSHSFFTPVKTMNQHFLETLVPMSSPWTALHLIMHYSRNNY